MGFSSDKRKLHLVGWNKIIKSKEKGALGYISDKGKKYGTASKA